MLKFPLRETLSFRVLTPNKKHLLKNRSKPTPKRHSLSFYYFFRFKVYFDNLKISLKIGSRYLFRFEWSLTSLHNQALQLNYLTYNLHIFYSLSHVNPLFYFFSSFLQKKYNPLSSILYYQSNSYSNLFYYFNYWKYNRPYFFKILSDIVSMIEIVLMNRNLLFYILLYFKIQSHYFNFSFR
jgi:hypothetical protein